MYVVKRPGIEEFLERMHKVYEIVIYTASLSIYADPLLDEIDPSNYATYRLFREHCTFHNNAFVKDLSQLGRDLKDVIIVDNSPASYLFQPENAVPILTWIDDMEDTKLYELVPVLELMAHAADVRDAIKEVVKGDSIDYIEAAEILKRKFAPKPKPRPLINAWAEAPHLEARPTSAHKKELTARSKLHEDSAEPVADLCMGPLTPQYGKKGIVILNKQLQQRPSETTKKPARLVKKGLQSEENSAAKTVRKPSVQKATLENTATEDSPAKRRPATEHSEKRKKSSTPTPYSGPGLSKASANVKSVAHLKEKTLPLHQQPRQHSAASKKRPEGIRAATPKNGLSPKKEGKMAPQQQSNPALNKAALFYSSLLRVKGTAEQTKEGKEKASKENCAVSGATLPTKAKPCILTGSNILRGLEESANKKLNKHSSSLDNTDWMACYEKLRKELNLNSPKDAPVSGRVSVNSVRPNGVVLLGEYLPKRQLVTPTPTNPFSAPKSGPVKITAATIKSSAKDGVKPMLVANNEKFANMMVQLGGKQGGTQRPVVLSRQKR